MADHQLLGQFFSVAVFDVDPLITFTGWDPKQAFLLDIMTLRPDLFEDRHGVHFVKMTWTIETADISDLCADIRDMNRRFPTHQIVMLAASEHEAALWASNGIATTLANSSIFQDENTWTVGSRPFPELPQGSPLYNAHFAPFKRHELCSLIEKPLFVYGRDPNDPHGRMIERVRRLCPSAIFVNHALNEGTYAYLNEEHLCRVNANASVALCLSAEEGHMRASIQSLLCGLPVVSTPSIGGRDRYYCGNNALIVEDTPEAVLKGVELLKSYGLSRADVRRATLGLIEADRRHFTTEANKMLSAIFGSEAPELDIADLRGWTSRYVPVSDFIALLGR